MKKTFIFLFTAVLAVTGLCVFAGEDRVFSDNENRQLTVMDDVMTESVRTGDFQKALTEYSSDQMPGRDSLMALATAVKKITGRKDIGGAYIGRDGFYFDKKLEKDINSERYERNLKIIEKTAGNYPEKKVTVMLVPGGGSVYSSKLPENAELFDDDKLYELAVKTLSKCKVVNMKEALIRQAEREDSENLYYRTDHHWTLDGAYVGYEELMGKKCPYEMKEVCSDFLGTLYSKVLDKSAEKAVGEGGSLDRIKIPVINDKIKVTTDGKPVEMFDMEMTKEKDKYKVYFGGNHGITQIETGVSGKGKLAVIKDSFANCLVPLLAGDYKEIVMIDMRYFAGDMDMVAGDADEILFLYELSSFASDSNISKLGL